MNIRRWTPLLIALSIALATGPAWARVEAFVDAKDLHAGETVTLTLRARDAARGGEPDIGALDDDFHVLAVSQTHRTHIINGQIDEMAEWHVTMLPRRTGAMTIPAVPVGPESSQPIDVIVSDEPAPVAGSRAPGAYANQVPTSSAPAVAPLSLTARVDQSDPYVQEQVVLTLRLEASVPVLEGQIADPVIPGAIVERLGEDRQGSSDADGNPINFVERSYAVFPQHSGPLDIDAISFDGLTPTPAASTRQSRHPFDSGFRSRIDAMMGRSGLDPFDDPFFDDFFAGSGSLFDQVMGPRGQAVRVQSQPISLEVQPRPDAAIGARWLPARDLELIEVWGDGQKEPPLFRVGEPVDRLVAVRARGVTATQLPAPNLADPSGIKQYAEPAYEESQNGGGDMVAVRAVPTVLIPNREGELELPAVELAWWDTEANAARTATLPARTVTVLPGAEPATDIAQTTPPIGPPTEGTPTSHDIGGDGGSTGLDGLMRAWPLPAGGIALLIAASVWIARRNRRTPSAPNSAPSPQPGPVARRLARAQAERDLARACRADDPMAAEAALLAIGRARFGDAAPATVSALAARLGDPEFDHEVMLLLSGRYAADSTNWSGAGLWDAYRASRGTAARGADDDPELLPPLYPGSPSYPGA